MTIGCAVIVQNSSTLSKLVAIGCFGFTQISLRNLVIWSNMNLWNLSQRASCCWWWIRCFWKTSFRLKLKQYVSEVRIWTFDTLTSILSFHQICQNYEMLFWKKNWCELFGIAASGRYHVFGSLCFGVCFSWLLLSQFFHKWRNIVKFSREFIFGIVERIKLKISSFCHFCHQKREFDVILTYNKGLHVIAFSGFSNLKSTSCKTHHSHIVHENDIKLFFLMTKVTKWWNF